MDDAVAEGGTEFWYLASTPGGEETLLPPDLAPNRGESVSEGGPLLAVPGGRCNAQASVTAEAVGQQGHDREQAEQAGRGAGDGLVGPLPLGFDAEVVAGFSERDLYLPTLCEPAEDLQRLLRGVGTEQGLWVEAPAGVTQQHPTDRHHRQAAMAPEGGLGADLHHMALLSNFGPGVLTDFGPPAVPQPRVSWSDRGAWHGQESQSGFVRAASPRA